MRVLVCEDETIIRLDLCQLLESAGLKVVGEARDGEEAVRMAAELEPDMILMDVRMPESTASRPRGASWPRARCRSSW